LIIISIQLQNMRLEFALVVLDCSVWGLGSPTAATSFYVRLSQGSYQ